MQDIEAESLSFANKANRAEAKASINYSNANWDLVDAMHRNQINLNEIDKSTLPEKYKNMSNQELKSEIEKMNNERLKIQREIIDLSTEREKFIQAELDKTDEGSADLGKAITDAVLKFANKKGYTQEK